MSFQEKISFTDGEFMKKNIPFMNEWKAEERYSWSIKAKIIEQAICAVSAGTRFEPGLKEREEGEKSKSSRGTLLQTKDNFSQLFSFVI